MSETARREMPLILIVDDDATTNQLLQYTLIREGFQTITAFAVSDALVQIREGRPDLVLLDVGLPDGTGFDVCHALHKEHGDLPMPILFISANEDVATKVNALEAGAVDYIGKPIAIPEVLARVRTHLHLKEVSANLAKLHERELVLQTLVDNAADAIFITDTKGRITYFNHAAELMFGWESDEVTGADFSRVVAPLNHAEQYEKAFAEIRCAPDGRGAVVARRFPAMRKDGTEFTLELSLSGAGSQTAWHTFGTARACAH